MNVLEIPFVEKVGLKKGSDGRLELKIESGVQNHLQSIHAEAQFTLAETANGELLQTLFPDIAEKVIPLLRDAQIKSRQPAQKNITAFASIAEESKMNFLEQLTQKRRALIAVNVIVKYVDETVTC